MDKAQEDSGEAREGADMAKNNLVENSLENNGVEDNLDSLKESLNNNDNL